MEEEKPKHIKEFEEINKLKPIDPTSLNDLQVPNPLIVDKERLDRLIDMYEKMINFAKENNFNINDYLMNTQTHLDKLPTLEEIENLKDELVPKLEDDLRRIFAEIMILRRGQ